MKPLLIALAERIGWSKTDIDLDLLLTYYRKKRMGDNNATNTRQELNKSNPATQVLRHFVDLRYKMERALDRSHFTRKPLTIGLTTPKSVIPSPSATVIQTTQTH